MDPRIVLTLDAGGTKLAFNAVQDGRELLEPVVSPAHADNLEKCLAQIRAGFRAVHEKTARAAVAISFAFPGPSDYSNGIIGDLGNLPGFRGGVPLGPMLQDEFGLPVYLNNDGDLFAYGEALGGLLPWVNEQLAKAGSPRRYRNLIGITMGTGFGGGIVHDGKLLRGDNSAAGEVWLLRHRDLRDCFAEEGVSIRAVKREFGAALEPDEIARLETPQAHAAFRRLGEVAGDAIAEALTLIDGLVVIGGGLSGAHRRFMPALIAELNGSLQTVDGKRVDRLEVKAFDLESQLDAFLHAPVLQVKVPGSNRTVPYDPHKRTGVGISRLGTSAAVSLGAWAFALKELDK